MAVDRWSHIVVWGDVIKWGPWFFLFCNNWIIISENGQNAFRGKFNWRVITRREFRFYMELSDVILWFEGSRHCITLEHSYQLSQYVNVCTCPTRTDVSYWHQLYIILKKCLLCCVHFLSYLTIYSPSFFKTDLGLSSPELSPYCSKRDDVISKLQDMETDGMVVSWNCRCVATTCFGISFGKEWWVSMTVVWQLTRDQNCRVDHFHDCFALATDGLRVVYGSRTFANLSYRSRRKSKTSSCLHSNGFRNDISCNLLLMMALLWFIWHRSVAPFTNMD